MHQLTRNNAAVLVAGLALAPTGAAGAAELPATRERLARKQPVKIVCLGDSVTGVYYHTGGRRAYPEMVPVAIRKALPDADVSVVNAGISGNSTVDALKRLDRDVLAHRPHLVTVMFALNDMVRVPIGIYRANLKAIIAKCRAAGAEVMICTPNGVIATPGRSVEKLVEYCDAMRAVAREEKTLFCDSLILYEAMRQRDPVAWRRLLSDEFHPNMDGHKITAQAIAREVTGKEVSLKDVGPLQPAIPRTLARLKAGETLRVLAMPPYDQLIAPALKKLEPGAKVEVMVWPTAGRTLPEIEADAKSVRQKKLDLVLVAVPASARADSDEQAHRAWCWILNSSLSFGHQEWDVVGILPSVAQPNLTGDEFKQDALARHMIRAQDLDLIERKPGDDSSPAMILEKWLQEQRKSGSAK